MQWFNFDTGNACLTGLGSSLLGKAEKLYRRNSLAQHHLNENFAAVVLST